MMRDERALGYETMKATQEIRKLISDLFPSAKIPYQYAMPFNQTSFKT